MRCARCGTALPFAGSGCPICAAYDAGRASASAQRPGKSGRKIAAIALGCLALVAVGAAGILHFRGGQALGASRAAQTRPSPILGGLRGSDRMGSVLAMSGQGTQGSVLEATGTQPPDGSLMSARGSDSTVGTMAAQGSDPNPTILNAKGEDDAPTLRSAKSQGHAPTLSDEQAGMPEDVRRWLEHLERIERRRTTMASQQMVQAISTMARLQGEDLTGALGGDDEDETREAMNRRMNNRANSYISETEAMRRQWTQLMTDFHSMQPPSECVSIRNSYDQVVNNTGSMMLEINDAVRSAAENQQRALQVLMGMQGTSNDRIDRFAKDADSGVEGVCRRYGTRKWFDIKSDIGGGALSQLGF